MAAHRGQRILHDAQILLVAPHRRQPRCCRLDDGAQLEQVAHELDVGFAGKGPGQHFRVQQVPAIARQHAGARLGPAFDQPLGGQHLDRLAIGAARYFQFLGKGDFARQRVAGLILAGQDRHAQLVRDRAMQPATGAARRLGRPSAIVRPCPISGRLPLFHSRSSRPAPHQAWLFLKDNHCHYHLPVICRSN